MTGPADGTTETTVTLASRRDTIRTPDRAAEANHRVANQLGQLAVLLEKQIRGVQDGPDLVPRAAVVEALRLHHGRLLGIAGLHRAISRRPDEDVVALHEVLPDLLREFRDSCVFENRLQLHWTLADGCRVGADQASAAMLVFSEIVTNAMKYAHPTKLPVELAVVAEPAANGGVTLVISDDGIGLPEGFDEARDAGLGIRLVRSLIESVGGRVSLSSSELGVTFHIELPPP